MFCEAYELESRRPKPPIRKSSVSSRASPASSSVVLSGAPLRAAPGCERGGGEGAEREIRAGRGGGGLEAGSGW